ncbi:MAG TPA: hypothetical protein DCP08_09065 [Chloroflexi bacterium]|nr:hypothetical protein [Chloroflexota bacterium]
MTDANQVVRRLLDYLEPRIDLDHLERVAARHRAALRYEEVDRVPLVCYLPYEGEDFTPYPYPEAFADPAKLMVNELLSGFTSIYEAVGLRDDAPYCLRPNLGIAIIASMLGGQIRVVGDQLPWVVPFEDMGAIQKIVDAPVPDTSSGLLPRVLDQYAYFREVLAGCPKCHAAFQLTLPDLQGPFDTAELLMGSDIFLAFYQDTELLSAFLSKITDTMLVAYRRLIAEVRDNIGPECQYQHAVGVKGKILLRSDSVLMISPEQYRDLVMPHDARLAEELNGIAIHFCGNGQHQVDNMLSISKLQCLDLGQSWMMDVDAIYAKASVRKVPLARVVVSEAELRMDQVSQRFPTGVILVYRAETVSQGKEVWRQYVGEACGRD